MRYPLLKTARSSTRVLGAHMGILARLTAFRCPYGQIRPFLSLFRTQLPRSTHTVTSPRRNSLAVGRAIAVRRNAGRADRLYFLSAKQGRRNQRRLTCVTRKRKLNCMSVKFERVSSSAVEAIISAAYLARDRGASQPAQHDQGHLSHRPFRAGTSRSALLKCKQPPLPDGCFIAVRDHLAVFCQLSIGTLT